MPKQSFPINSFDKGLNNKDSARDLEEGFLAEATNVDISEKGKVICLGTFGALGTATDVADGSLSAHQSGYGLFKFRADIVPTGGGTGGEYLAYTDGAGIVKMNTAAEMVQFDSADLGSDSDCKPVYYYADGGLRISDSDHGNTNNKTIAIQRISRASDMYSAVSDQMKKYTGTFAAPADGEIDALSSPTDPASGVEEGTDPTSDIKVEIVSSSSKEDGLWAAAEYNIGLSYVYYGEQESKISDVLGNITLADAQYPIVSVSVGDGDISTTAGGAFVQGMRIYLKDINDSEAEHTLLLDIDFEQKGSRKSLADSFNAMNDKSGAGSNHWVTNDASHASATTSASYAYAIKSPGLDTYSTINGYSPDEQEISFNGNASYKYKTAEVANQRVFVGNVRYLDNDATLKSMGDRIQYTPVRKYDLFPQSYYLDLGTNDGDEIVKILYFSPYLFVFKKNKLTVINLESGSDAGWYVEKEYEGRGISNPGAVTKAPQGLMWANENGLFSWQMHKEGTTKTETTFEDVGNISSIIKDSTWQSKIDADYVQVGYIPKEDKIIIVGSANALSGDDPALSGYMYDINTKSLVNIDTSSVLIDKHISNFVILNEELVTFRDIDGDDGDVYRWIPAPAAQTIDIKTKELTFDKPSVDKRFYSVFATYEDGNSAVLTAGLDGASPSDIFTDTGNTNALNATSMGTEEFLISSGNRGGKSIQFRINGSASSTFELQDLSVILRAKGER